MIINTQRSDQLSNYPISFHYINEHLFYELQYYLYNVKLYGVVKGTPPSQLFSVPNISMSMSNIKDVNIS